MTVFAAAFLGEALLCAGVGALGDGWIHGRGADDYNLLIGLLLVVAPLLVGAGCLIVALVLFPRNRRADAERKPKPSETSETFR